MTVTVNGEPATLPAPCTVTELLQARGATRGVAVAVNETFVPRSQYDSTRLQDGDTIEIVAPMQGG